LVTAPKGEESKEPLRLEAIAHCHAANRGHWREPPESRRRAYNDYIRQKHDLDASRLRGFGVKSWEDSESVFKQWLKDS
jgi:hypothetical protein